MHIRRKSGTFRNHLPLRAPSRAPSLLSERRGTRRFLSLSRERDDPDSESLETLLERRLDLCFGERDLDRVDSDPESESLSDSDSDPSLSLSELELESLPDPERRAFFARCEPSPLSPVPFSFSSEALLPLPPFLNSSGTSTLGLPSSRNFAIKPGFAIC